MPRYAQDTAVSSDRSREEIERTLRRYGADQFAYGWDRDKALIGFQAHGRQVRFTLPLPDRNDPEFHFTPSRKTRRSPEAAATEWEKSTRQRWRALALVIKAKLEAVEAGISTFETEFLAHTMLPNGETAAEWMEPQIAEAYETGAMPRSLLALGPGEQS